MDPGSSVHGILQARILEWIAMPSSGDLPDPGIEPTSPTSPALLGLFVSIAPSGKPYICSESESINIQFCPTLCNPMDYSPCMEFSRQEYLSGLPFLYPGYLPDPEMEPGSPVLQADSSFFLNLNLFILIRG